MPINASSVAPLAVNHNFKTRETPLGIEIQASEYLVFFGNIHSDLVNLKKFYPQFHFVGLKQTHSDKILIYEKKDFITNSYEEVGEGDSLVTKEKKTALCIRTADCMPIFFYESPQKIVAAIHAGWRGVAQNIAPKTLDILEKKFSASSDILKIFVGPHILQKNFEVDKDTLNKILDSLSLSEGNLLPFYKTSESSQDQVNTEIDLRAKSSQITHDQKYYPSLIKILSHQLMAKKARLENLIFIENNTYSDLSYHSYRREAERSGRQNSFIVLL